MPGATGRLCLITTGEAVIMSKIYWVVRRPNGQESGPFSTHAEALAYARRVPGGGTPVKREA